ncbi:SGNH/GDSL hydrolase family protein [Streptomyces sp. NPDC049099]|uniref:SGNH/GDSL hydrolase family protein n=1 Tax=Streptomyces sp. NPDC049099 TaxID=3155768 RepID=UPI00341AC7E8
MAISSRSRRSAKPIRQSGRTLVVVLMAVLTCLLSAPAGAGSASADATRSSLRLFVMGDSIAGGSDEGGYGSHGWPALVAARLGLTLTLDGEGGTGYTTAGPQPGRRAYPQRVDDAVAAAPDVVIVEGSRNDLDPTRSKAAAVDTLRRLRAGLPHARILVIGPIYSDPQPVASRPVDDAVAAVADEVPLPYVSAVRRAWFTGSAHQFIGSDGVHPTDAGHVYLADQISPEVSRLLGY